VAIIFQETFDTIGPWTYSNPGSLDPDAPRITRGFDSTPLPSNPEQIASEANYPGGLGGLGNLHWMGEGSNSQSNSLNFNWATDEPEIWVRYYAKWEAGMVFNPGYSKDCDLQLGSAVRVIFGHQNGAFGFWRATGSPDYFLTGSISWNDIMGGSASDGNWHCFEFHLKYSNAGAGEAGIWIDDVDAGSTTGLTFAGSTGWRGYTTFVNQSSVGAGGPYKVYLDDIVVSNSGRVGPLGGGSPPAVALRPSMTM
jgi:hypothetical protein